MGVWTSPFGAKPPFRRAFQKVTVEDSRCSQCFSPSLSHPFYSSGNESHHPSPSDCLTRSSISDTQLRHPEQSLFSDRKAAVRMAPQRLERGEESEVVGEEACHLCHGDLFPAMTGRLFFPGGQMGFLPLAQFQQAPKRQCVILMVSDRSPLLQVNMSCVRIILMHIETCSFI